jgi:hypothetical protein
MVDDIAAQIMSYASNFSGSPNRGAFGDKTQVNLNGEMKKQLAIISDQAETFLSGNMAS